MTTSPKVSVIIPVHNSSEFLAPCLESVLSQTLTNIEVICIDDASTDNSLDVLKQFASHDPRLAIIALQNNAGPGAARNIALDRATGKYCISCDSDDVYPPYALEKLVAAAEAENVPLCGGNIIFMDYALKRILGVGDCVASTQFFERAVVNPREYPPVRLAVYHPRYLIEREFLNAHDIRYPALMRGEDPPFLAKLFCIAESMVVLPDVVYFYRGAKPGVNKLLQADALNDYIEHIKLTHDIYLKYDDVAGACLFLALTVENMCCLTIYSKFTHAQRKAVRDILLRRVKMMTPFIFEQDYAPYPLVAKEIEKKVAMLKKGPNCYLAWIFFKKITGFCKKLARKLGGCNWGKR